MDNVTINRLSLLHPKLRAEVSDIIGGIHNTGIDIRIVQGFRSFADQDALYAQGRSTPGNIVTYAKGGQSYHCYGLAIDFCLLHKDGSISFDMHEDLNHDQKADWLEVVNSFKFKGWTWGGDFKNLKDNDHVEKSFGLSFDQCLALKNSGQVDENGYILIS